MKISVIGAGNVGSTTAMRIAQENLGEVLLVDIVKGIAQGKALDLEDARSLLKINYQISGTQDINQIENSDIVVVTAGLPRKPGMTREELIDKNAEILNNVCLNIKTLAAQATVIVVTNPLDIMTYLALKITGFKPQKLFGMGVSLDAARFANLISRELDVNINDVKACVIGTHGEGMLPLARFSTVKGNRLDELLDKSKIDELLKRTFARGAEIVGLLGSGSAYYAPSAAIADIVKAIVKDELREIGACAFLNGEYGLKDLCIGVPCIFGKTGLEKVIQLDLNSEEKEALSKSASSTKTFLNPISNLPK